MRYGAAAPGRQTPLSALRAGVGALADAVWPRRCLVSGERISGPGLIAAQAFTTLRFLGDPQCAACGWPFDEALGPDVLCAACEADRPKVSRTRAALAYDEASRDLILALKHRAERAGVAAFAGWMAHAGAALLAEADVLVPVPLHARRAFDRGFNQSGWLARELSARGGPPTAFDALLRTRDTGGQGGRSASGRARNVAGAFAVAPGRKARIAGRRVVLIDDVRTTGATLDACARALFRAGAADVDALCLARVVRPERTPI